MPITIQLDGNYAGESSEIDKKYHLIDDVDISEITEEEIAALSSKRGGILQAVGCAITFNCSNSYTLIRGSTLPPVIVPSSGRAIEIFESIGKYTGGRVSINNTVVFGNIKFDTNNNICPPIYSPLRLEEGRQIIILVHVREYASYQTALAETRVSHPNLILIAYQIGELENELVKVGLGASRLAAQALGRWLANTPTAGRFWIIDDDVIHISGLENLRTIETAMAAGVCACGFHGTKERYLRVPLLEKIGKNPLVGDAPKFTQDGILHQAMLFDLSQLQDTHFSDQFIKSRADPSYMAYLRYKQKKYGTYNQYQIYKGKYICDKMSPKRSSNNKKTKSDPDIEKLNAARKKTDTSIIDAEKAIDINFNIAFPASKKSGKDKNTEERSNNERARKVKAAKDFSTAISAAFPDQVKSNGTDFVSRAAMIGVEHILEVILGQLSDPNKLPRDLADREDGKVCSLFQGAIDTTMNRR